MLQHLLGCRPEMVTHAGGQGQRCIPRVFSIWPWKDESGNNMYIDEVTGKVHNARN